MNDTTPNRSIGHVLFIMGGDRIKFEDGAIDPIVGWGTRFETIGTYHGKEYNGELNIGTGCSFGLFCHIAAAQKITIGRDVMFASFVTVLDHDHGHGDLSRPPRYQPLQCKPVTIGDNCWIGEHVYIGPGVTIGHDSIIGANAVILKDVPPYSKAYGQPTKIVDRWALNTHGKTSIIIPTVGYSGILKCIDSIERHTHSNLSPYEIIIVVNGDEALEYLKDAIKQESLVHDDPDFWSHPKSFRKTVILPGENKGYAAAINAGVKAATGDYLCFLNDDTEVTDKWLERMLGTLQSFPQTGIVGPMSDFIAGPQKADPGYDIRDHWGQAPNVPNVMGVCMLLRKLVWDRIGEMDERFGIGNFEDNDFCRRAIQYGWKIRVVKDAFVYHEGNQSFKLLGLDYHQILEENRWKYKDKWDKEATLSNI
jgi:acetyltransferase-like isoleucine patch superfamily enzyme/GT2 family glycosyltransferase